jgi:hypothetical protein
MTSLKKIAAAISVIGFVASAPAAFAGGGALTLTPDPIDIGWLSASFDNSFTSQGSFTDNWTFSVPASSASFYSVEQLWNVRFTPLRYFTGINSFSVGLYDASNSLVGSGQQFFGGPLAAGNYTLTVAGNVIGTGSGVKGTYTGLVEVMPVPEPESYALFLAGLGLMGFIARRRTSV